MESVVESLGALLVRALPTFILLVILHFYLKAVFFRPLEAALKERKAATAGVRKLADEAIGAAEKKAAEYEEALRLERGKIYKEQEEIRRRLREEQAARIAGLRREMETEITEARGRVAREKEAQRGALASQAEALAEQITRSVLGGTA